MSGYYRVVKGDTLHKIAKTNGTTVNELIRLNQIKNPSHLEVGQQLALKRETVLGFQPLFLDHNRDPISGIEYILEFAGKIIRGITGESGFGKKIFTETPDDEVRIFVKRFDGTLKEVGRTVSGYGNKLVNIISPSVKIEARAERHLAPVSTSGRPVAGAPDTPAFDPKAKQTPTTGKQALGLEKRMVTTPDGMPITVIKGDIPDLTFLDEYNGEVATEEDYEWAAHQLGIEKAAIKAFSLVESGGGGFIHLQNKLVPKILYERHYFAKFTRNKYSAKYPDISLPCGYYVAGVKYVEADSAYKRKHRVPEDVNYYRSVSKKRDSRATRRRGLEISELLKQKKISPVNDKYLLGISNYKRLTKAYQLNKDAALESCSWNKYDKAIAKEYKRMKDEE